MKISLPSTKKLLTLITSKRRKTGLLFICLFAVLSYLAASPISGQQDDGRKRTITGVVLDSNGETVIGASLFQRGTSNGTVTSADGTSSIELE